MRARAPRSSRRGSGPRASAPPSAGRAGRATWCTTPRCSLDGADIWDSGDKPVTDDLVTVAERPVKPGPHALTLRIDIRPGKKSKDSDKLGYVSEHTFAIIVPDGKRTRVAIKGDEDGDAPEYEPEIEVELETLK